MSRGRECMRGALALCALVGILTAPACVVAEAKVVNGVIATVNGKALTLGDLRDYKRKRGPFLPVDQRGDYRVLLDSLVESHLLRAEFEKNAITADDSDVNVYIDTVLKQGQSTREDVRGALADAGLTWEDYFERMREEVQRLALINLLIRSRVNVTPEEIEREWETNPTYRRGERVEIAHIFLPFPSRSQPAEREAVRKQAAELYESVRRRGFEEAAKQHSAGPTAAEGGTLGEFERGTMAPHFEQAVAALAPGQVAPPVEDASGIHIVKLLRVLPGDRVPLESVEQEIRDRLYDERLEARFRRWADEDLRKAHHVTLHLEALALLAAS